MSPLSCVIRARMGCWYDRGLPWTLGIFSCRGDFSEGWVEFEDKRVAKQIFEAPQTAYTKALIAAVPRLTGGTRFGKPMEATA